MEEPTPAQTRILAYFVDYIARVGIPPTIRDVMRGMGFSSPNAVVGHVDALIKKGKLKRVGANQSRAVVPTSCEAVATCPTCGAPTTSNEGGPQA